MASTVNFKLDLGFTHYACFFKRLRYSMQCYIYVGAPRTSHVLLPHFSTVFDYFLSAQKDSILKANISTSTEEIASITNKYAD